MQGKNIALIFEKIPTCTRCAFEVVAYGQGAGVAYLESSAGRIGHKGNIKDTACVLGRMFDGVEYHGSGQDVVGELAKYTGVPMLNGLTNKFHPTQMFVDTLTTREHSDKPLNQVVFAYVGDACCNMANSLLVLAAKLGTNVRIGVPKSLWPSGNIIGTVQAVAEETGGRILLTEGVKEAAKGVDSIHIDMRVSMGEPKEAWQERIDLLKDYRVTPELMTAAENLQVRSIHCLPAFHNRKTRVGEWIYEIFGLNDVGVTEEVFESEASIVFDQTENRMHMIKAVMVAILGD